MIVRTSVFFLGIFLLNYFHFVETEVDSGDVIYITIMGVKFFSLALIMCFSKSINTPQTLYYTLIVVEHKGHKNFGFFSQLI